MNATMTVGEFEVAKDSLWDPEMERWYIHVGIESKKGIEIHYTVRGRTAEGTKKRAKRLAEIMTVWKVPKTEEPWEPYTGDYEKEYYDVKLLTGEIVENCYPNADTFHVLKENGRFAQGCIIEGATVAEIRHSLYDPFKRDI